MNRARRLAAFAMLISLMTTAAARPLDAGEIEEGFEKIFNGKTLEGWDGNPKFWKVEEGAITGQTTEDNPTEFNTFLVWENGKPGDFELKLEYRIIGGNSGIQYRSFRLKDAADKWRIGGYQADFEAGDTYSGIIYGEQARGILALRGQKVEIDAEGNKTVTETFGDSKEIQDKIKKEDWNAYHIVAKGNHLTQYINGVKTAELIDNDQKATGKRMDEGLIAFQLHAGPPMKVQFRNVRLKADKADKKVSGETKKVVLIAGRKSHGYGAHEHKAGCMLLAEALNASGLPIEASVVTDGWPEDTSVLDDADSIVIYADGGGGHPFNAHIEAVDKLMKEGVGLVCIHYGVEVPKGKSGDAFLDWTGGYFETNWSVNPHWTASYREFEKHSVTRGVRPFAINDEWYYHMRFRENLDDVTPILTDLPPESTLSRPDGPHSGNPAVRKAVLENREPQHTAWARERPDGGRGFGFTGGHVHWNWGHDEFRKLMLNAIAWTAQVEVPNEGVPSKPLSVDDLMANQDYDVPENFNPARIQALLDEWNRQPADP